MKRIYVQIPAYRDAELLPTVVDLLQTANTPDRLSVAVALQYGPDEADVASRLSELGCQLVLEVPAAQSNGCNWARNVLQTHWSGEEYTLLLDSHHRFVPGWDDRAIEMLESQRRAGYARPIITGYLPPYDPTDDPEGRVEAIYDLVVQERFEGMAYRLHGHPMDGWSDLRRPTPSPFVSLHFLFADGGFNADVPCDPDIYFFADEVTMALRSFSWGYDLFCPHEILGWHLYDRETRVTHWSDHPDWRKRQQVSMSRLKALYAGELDGSFGLGINRSVDEYETYAGIRLQQKTNNNDSEAQPWYSKRANAISSPRGFDHAIFHPTWSS